MNDDFEAAWVGLLQAVEGVERAAREPSERASARQLRHALHDIDVIGSLAHDIKDPLASLIMGLTLLQRSDAVMLRPVLANAAMAARRLDRIVDNVRQLEIVRRGSYTLRPRAFPVASVVGEIVAKLRENQRGVQVELIIEKPSARAFGDPSVTTRILEELIDNAMGFSPLDGRVVVLLTVIDPHVLVSVTDEGAGIDETHMQHVFDETKNRKHQPRRGPGRGLPLAAALADLQSGSLRVDRNMPTGLIAELKLKAA